MKAGLRILILSVIIGQQHISSHLHRHQNQHRSSTPPLYGLCFPHSPSSSNTNLPIYLVDKVSLLLPSSYAKLAQHMYMRNICYIKLTALQRPPAQLMPSWHTPYDTSRVTV